MAAGDVALNLIVSASTGAAMSGLQGVGKAISDMAGGGIMGKIAEGAVAVTAGLVTIGVAAVKSAGDFQMSMTKLVTSAGESKSAIGLVSAGILQMSIDTGTSTTQLANGMYYIESAGYHGANGLNVLRVAAMGAKTEGADLDTVSKALTTVMVDYGMKSTDAAKAMNGLIATVQNGKTNLQQLASSMGAVLPIASAMHISFPQVAGAMAAMTNAGMSAQQASQNLAHVLIALESPNAVAAKSMYAVGLTAQQVKDMLVNQGLPQALQLIEDHVGKKFPAGSVEGETALKNIMGGLVGLKLAAMLTGPSLAAYKDDIAKITAAMKDGSGAVLGWSDIQGNFNFKMDQAKQALNVLMITLGTALLPVVGQVIGAISNIITAFTTWETKTHAIEGAISSISGVVGGMGSTISGVMGKVSQSMSQTTATMQLQVIGHTQAMAQTTIKTLEGQRAAYERLANDSKNSVVQHMNEMKIQSIDAAIQTNQGVVNNAKMMAGGLTAALDAVNPQAHVAMLKLQLGTINSTIATKTGTLNQMEDLRDKLTNDFAQASNDGTRHMIQLKLNAVNAAIATNQGVVSNAEALRTGVTANLKQTQDSINQVNATPLGKLQSVFTQIMVEGMKFMPVITKIGASLNSAFQSNLPSILSFVEKAFQTLGMAMLNMSPGINLIDALARHAQDLGKWFQSSVIPAIKQAEPGFKNLWSAIAGLLPVITQVAAIVHSTFQKAFDMLLPVFEKMIPIVIQLAGMIAGALGSAIKFLAPYIVQAVAAIGKFVDEIVQRVVPIIMQWIAGLQQFLKIWQQIWPFLVPILKGIWDQIVGVIQIAWAIITGLFKVTLDLISGNWKQAWTDMGDMFQGIWAGIVKYFSGGWDIIKGIVVAMVNGIESLFTGLWNDLTRHSIIPNMISDIIAHFTKMVSDVISSITGFITNTQKLFGNLGTFFSGWFSSLASNFGKWGTNALSMFTNAITSGTKNITNAVTNIGSTIVGILGFHSPPTNGPLSTSDQWMPNMVTMMANGITSNSPKVTTATTNMAVGVNNQFTNMNNQVSGNINKLNNTVNTGFQSMSSNVASNTNNINNSMNGLQSNVTSKSAAINSALAGMSSGAISNLNNLNGEVQTVSTTIPKATTTIGSSISQVTPIVTNATGVWSQNMVDAGQIASTAAKQVSNSVGNMQQTATGAVGVGKQIASTSTTTIKASQDMNKSVGNNFSELPEKGQTAQQKLNTIWDGITKAASQGMSNFAGNINDMVKMAEDGAKAVAAAVANMLGHSTPKMGPLKGDDEWGEHFMQNIIGGMHKGMPQLTATTNAIASVLAGGIKIPLLTATPGMEASNIAEGLLSKITLPQQRDPDWKQDMTHITLQLDSKTIADATLPRIAKEIHIQAGVRKL